MKSSAIGNGSNLQPLLPRSGGGAYSSAPVTTWAVSVTTSPHFRCFSKLRLALKTPFCSST